MKVDDESEEPEEKMNRRQAGGAGSENRAFERLAAEISINLMVSLHGFDPDDHHFEAKGMTINISRKGLLTRVNRPVAENSRCLVHIPGGEGRLGRTLIYGVVRRTTEVKDYFEVAVEFDTPLEFLRAPAEDGEEAP
ncbi:MAG: PilZ domain-containing protein [Acidobacteriota bacterium]